MSIDVTTISSDILRGFVDLFIGILAGYAAFLFARRRDELLKKEELEEEERKQIRNEIMKGIDDPKSTLKTIKNVKVLIESLDDLKYTGPELSENNPQKMIFELDKVIRLLTSLVNKQGSV